MLIIVAMLLTITVEFTSLVLGVAFTWLHVEPTCRTTVLYIPTTICFTILQIVVYLARDFAL